MAAIRPFANFRERPRCRRDEDRQRVDDPGDGKQENHPKYPPGLGRHDMAGSIDVQCRAAHAICALFQTATSRGSPRQSQPADGSERLYKWTCLRTVQCVAQQRMTDKKAAPEDEPEVKHELGLGGREHP